MATKLKPDTELIPSGDDSPSTHTPSQCTPQSYGSHIQLAGGPLERGFPSHTTKLQTPSYWQTNFFPFMLLVLYNTVMPGFEIFTVSVIGYYTGLPFIFPSLGPEAFLHFAVPDKLPASPRNSICGHFLGCLWGYIGLAMTGLSTNTHVFDADEGITWPRVGCVSFAIAMTCGTMILFNCSHPPAGATTLIVALGIMCSLRDIGILMSAVTILCCETWVITKIFRRDLV
eukprot:UN07722